MTLPWAVDPEDRSEPVAQLKPAPSKVVPPPALAEPLAAADPPPPAAAEVVVAVLVSLPQEPSVNAPRATRATRATRPLIRVVFTPILHGFCNDKLRCDPL